MCRFAPGLIEQAGEIVRAAATDEGGVESSALFAAFLYWQNRTDDCLKILDKVLEQAPHHSAARQLQREALAAAARRSPGASATPLPQLQETVSSYWQAFLQSWKGLKKGLAWAAPRPLADSLLRSIPLTEFAPLGGLPDVTFFSLQQGTPAREIAQPPVDMECVPLSDALSSPLHSGRSTSPDGYCHRGR